MKARLRAALRRAPMAALAAVALLLLAAPACSNLVGDSCETSADCGSQMYCEQSLPDGYCTVRDCLDRTCPDEGICIRFTEDVSYCMAPCESKSDCRDGYRCVKDFGPHGFCDDDGSVTPTAE
ncbi:MAG: hypothetical protein KC635_05840 [Myxococcales bacterium]|nr:hypothetical protein [Myxococcales bacterium]MCB9735680.1 hypothetical protein [Deltaproteobacteria bacterium]